MIKGQYAFQGAAVGLTGQLASYGYVPVIPDYYADPSIVPGLTVQAMARPIGTQTGYIIRSGAVNTGTRGFSMTYNTGRWFFYVNDGVKHYSFSSATGTAVLNEIAEVGFRLDRAGQRCYFYKNGLLLGSHAGAAPAVTTNPEYQLYFGAGTSGSSHLQGDLFYVRSWDSTFTEAQYQAESGGQFPSVKPRHYFQPTEEGFACPITQTQVQLYNSQLVKGI